MAVNPCCMPLQKGVTLMAVIDVIFSTIDLIVAILVLLYLTVWTEHLTNYEKFTKSEIDISIAMACILIIIAILGLLLSLRLYFGAKKRDIKNCRIWLIVKMILFCIDFLSLIVGSSAGKEESYSLAVTIIVLIYRIYMMYCVYCFIQEMKMDASRLGFQARLEGGVAYQMDTFPQGNPGNPYQGQQQQPTVFVTSNAYPPPQYPPQYPPPYATAPSPQQNPGAGGIPNPNHSYYNNTS